MKRKFKIFCLSLTFIFIFISLSACSSGNFSVRNTLKTNDFSSYDKSIESSDYSGSNESERRKIKSYELEADTRNFDETYNNIKSDIKKYGGYIDNSSFYNENVKNIYLSIFIPQKNTDNFLLDIKNIQDFNLLSEREYSNDAENDYIDIETRLNVLQKRLEKLQEIQKEQKDIDVILNVEDKISQTVEEIEELKGNKQNLDNVVKFNKININLKEVFAEKTKQEQTIKFGDEIKNNIKETVEFYKTLFRLFVYLLIRFGPIALIVLCVLSLIKKFKKNNSKNAPLTFNDKNNNTKKYKEDEPRDYKENKNSSKKEDKKEI